MNAIFWLIAGCWPSDRIPPTFSLLKWVCKKKWLASEALTRVQEQLEQNGQFLRIPYNICINLVYSSFFYLENWRRYEPKCKKIDCAKMNRLSIFICEDSISFKPKNTFLTLDSQRPTIYQINGNFMRILMDLSYLKFCLCMRGKIQFYWDHFLCKSHYTMVNNKKVDSI